MNRLVLLLLALLAPLSGAHAQSSLRAQHYDARLVSQNATVAAGGKTTFALSITPDKGWHIYWVNPGESGYAPEFKWQLPKGVTVAPVQHPVPESLVIAGFASNVHEGETILLQDMKFPVPMAVGATVHLVVDVDMLVCSEASCVPDPISLSIDMKVGDGAANAQMAAFFAMARSALPIVSHAAATISAKGETATILLPSVHIAPGETAKLFGAVPQILSDSAQQSFSDTPVGTVITVKRGEQPIGVGLPLLLRIEKPGVAAKGYSFQAKAVDAKANGTRNGGTLSSFLLALGGALLGGLILNLMPCVFPILSLKAMALAKAGGNDREAKAEALGYSVGAIGVILMLGATLLALRGGGHALGWAFQLQDTRVVAVLLLLVTAIALNMAGLFELPSLSFNGNAKSGFAGSVGTGALAAFIATPCTGPFMAGALGAALVLPVPAAMAIFFGLGLGLALPFLLLGFWKPSRKWLPKPGAWMVRLRQVLSLPMFATAIGLAWIIGRQAGVNGMAMAAASAMLLALALWWYGLRQYSSKRLWPTAIPAVAALALAMILVPTATGTKALEAKPDRDITVFSAQKLADLQAQGKPFFLYLTADWCLSCKVNEATSLSSSEVRNSFAKAGVTVMRGDWTNGDPEITAFLKQHGKAGIPVYFWYSANGSITELPQVLTPSRLLGLEA
jgi:thiol:disulfide interchange protein/DsbC/DsbD-like thiol-disulfide interchange protein